MKNHTPLLILLLLGAFLSAVPCHAILLSHLRLINAETDEPIPGYDPIEYEAVIDLAALPTRNINIEAVLNDAFSAGSVRFIEFGRSQVKVDNSAPYAFGAEAEGDFEGMALHLGTYEFTTVAYTEANGGGTGGVPLRSLFSVRDSELYPKPTPLAAERLYLESDGLVVIEAENTASDYGQWSGENSIDGFTGAGYLRFNGNSPTNGPATSPLVYTFRIQRPGLYRLHLRCARETVDGRTDLANDCYVRVEGDYGEGPPPYSSHGDNAPLSTLQRNTKFFGGDHLNFVWASGNRLDLGGHNNKRVAIYDFKAGEEYTLVVSGRSQRFRLDRIVFRHVEVGSSTAESRSVPESSFVIEGAEQWAGYTLEEGKFINTGDWLGYLSVEYAPYVYSFDLSSWMYVEEDWLTDKGFWSFVFR